MALSCTAIRRDSVSFLGLPFLGQVQIFSCEMVFIKRLKRPLLLLLLLQLSLLLLLLLLLLGFFPSALVDGFHWSLSDNKPPQVSRTLLSILAVLNNVVVWIVSTRLPTSKSSSPFSNPLVTVPNAPITNDILSLLLSYLPSRPLGQDMTQGQFLSGV